MKKWTALFLCLTIGVLGGAYLLGPILHGQNQAPQNQPIQVNQLPDDLISFRGVVKKVLPAIVSLEAKRTQIDPRIPENPIPDFGEEVPEEFRKFFKDFQDKGFEIPKRSPGVGFGSGFMVSPDGVVMTNNHVVRNAEQVTIHLLDGQKFVSKDIFRDPKTDLAIFKFDTQGQELPFLEFGDSDAMEIGDRVLAFGAPFGLRGSVTHGIVSAKERSGLNLNMYEDFLQTDAAINPGNSGGPLVNLQGQVIGINAAIKSRTGGFNGVGLAVASNLAKRVKDGLLKDGVVRRGYLGVRIRDLDANVAEQLGIEKGTGVVVSELFANTPASKSGLKAGDIILKIDGKTVKDGRMLQYMVASAPLNKAVPFEILRDGKRRTVSVTVEEQPDRFGLAPARTVPSTNSDIATTLEGIGISIQNLTPELATKLGFPAATSGVAITDVESGSLAFTGGLSPGMLIVKIDNQSVNSVEEVQQALGEASLEKGVLLQVRSSKEGTNYVLLQVQT